MSSQPSGLKHWEFGFTTEGLSTATPAGEDSRSACQLVSSSKSPPWELCQAWPREAKYAVEGEMAGIAH